MAARFHIAGLFGGPVSIGLLGVAAALRPWLPSRHRFNLVLGASVLSGAYLLQWFIPLPLALTWFIVRASRWPWSTKRKLGVLLGTWLGLVLIGWLLIPHTGNNFSLLNIWMGFLPAAIIWLVLERASGRLDGFSEREEWLYFLSFPRFVAPFVQPLGASRFLRSRQVRQSPLLSLRALLLLLYAVVLYYVLANTHFSVKSRFEAFDLLEHGPRIFRNVCHIYAFNAAPIFMAVGLLRLLGYDLGSGFRWPTLASSPSDFFKRWNYYFFDFASIAIFVPIVSRLRRLVPLWLAYVVGAYASFALGVWLLGIVGNLPGDYKAHRAIKALTNIYDIKVHVTMWSMVIGAQLLLLPLRHLRRRRWWRPVGNVFTWGVAIAGLMSLFATQMRIY